MMLRSYNCSERSGREEVRKWVEAKRKEKLAGITDRDSQQKAVKHQVEPHYQTVSYARHLWNLIAHSPNPVSSLRPPVSWLSYGRNGDSKRGKNIKTSHFSSTQRPSRDIGVIPP